MKALFTPTLVFSLCFHLFMGQSMKAQADSLQKRIGLFLQAQTDNYEKKSRNLASRNLGSLENEPFAFKEVFMLQSQEKQRNNLGNQRYRKVYFNFYYYAAELDRQYALKFWLEDFIEGKSIRPGRPVRSYPYAVPTIILINLQDIIICSYDCKDYEYEDFKYWKKQMMQYFGQKESMVIEIQCDGPLEWTDNAPDAKIRGLF